ncbi:MAG: hypothetical protein KJ077_11190 [Anaerolineae bacterium]|nr:hypothetical protein [Anaerolineae bacterium]
MTHMITCAACGASFDEQDPNQKSSIECVCRNCARNVFFYCPECDHTRHTDDLAHEIRRLVGSEPEERHPEVFWGLCRDHIKAEPANTLFAVREEDYSVLEYRFFRGGVMGVSRFRQPFILVRHARTLQSPVVLDQFYLHPAGDWRGAARADAAHRGFRIVNIPDLKERQLVWAVLTPDGIPTQCRVVASHKTWVAVQSFKTNLIYDTLCDRVFSGYAEAKAFGSTISVKEMREFAAGPDDWLIVEVNDAGQPICALQWSMSEAGAEGAADLHRRRRPHHIQIIPPVKEVAVS